MSSLEERSFICQATWLPESASIQVQRADVVYRDGKEIAREYHRHVVGPTDDLTGEDDQVRMIAEAFASLREAYVAPSAEPAGTHGRQ